MRYPAMWLEKVIEKTKVDAIQKGPYISGLFLINSKKVGGIGRKERTKRYKTSFVSTLNKKL